MAGDTMNRETLERAIRQAIAADASLSRRRFLQVGGLSVVGLSALGPWLAAEAAPPVLVLPQAKGLVLADPTKCVGCRRCELACTEFNDGKAAPSMARVKIVRNLNFGPRGAFLGRAGLGTWGNGLVVQDVCRQCADAACAAACPVQAIGAKSPTNARTVDKDKCIGCRTCVSACPFRMMAFDEEAGRATKCTLCDGTPKCVEACPAAALRYVPWRELSRSADDFRTRSAGIPVKARSLRAHLAKRRDA
jgi:Fe-S-cluster-containing dehydrogenase component